MSTLPLFERDDRSGGSEQPVLRVAQLNRMVRQTLEDRWPNVWVEGELSDVMRAGSGHVYFTLNDETEPAQLRGVMFRSDARRAKAKLENGARVKLRGSLSLFEARGGFQLIARIALPYGLGELHAQFEAVRRKLEAEGLLEDARKRPLPSLPRVLGVVTSEQGAALHDIIRVAQERCPVRIVLAPCLVQGADAPRSIARAIKAVGRVPGLDLVIAGRGGGSAEDLAAWNDERVARAIVACPVPVVSAVGHEVDVSIADLVADLRAATPSNAAELAVPQREVLWERLSTAERRLERALEMRLARERLRMDRIAHRLSEPRTLLGQARSRLDSAQIRGEALVRERVRAGRRLHDGLLKRLSRQDPRLRLAQRTAQLAELRARLTASGPPLIGRRRARLGQQAARLDALSPLSVLGRGYAIALSERTGKALVSAGDAAPGDLVHLRLHEGQLTTRVQAAGPTESTDSMEPAQPTESTERDIEQES